MIKSDHKLQEEMGMISGRELQGTVREWWGTLAACGLIVVLGWWSDLYASAASRSFLRGFRSVGKYTTDFPLHASTAGRRQSTPQARFSD
jgi:hypothetical protein